MAIGEVENRFYVYQHTFADGSLYIGKGTGVRIYSYGDSRRGPLWQRAGQKYGKPQIKYISRDISESLACLIEKKLIKALTNRGCKLRNLTEGGHGGHTGLKGSLSPNYGKKRSPEWVQMMSEKHKGEGNPNFGICRSTETKQKISKNTKQTWETDYEKMRSLNQGRKFTKEHKAKIGKASASMSGESREKIRKQITGKKRTPEQIENYKRGAQKRHLVPMPEETREKMSRSSWKKDPIEYLFVGPEGQTFRGTQSAFKKHFGFSIRDLLRADKKKRPHIKGWRVEQN